MTNPEHFDVLQIEFDFDEAIVRQDDLLNVLTNLFQCRLFQPHFDRPCQISRCRWQQGSSDHGRFDVSIGVHQFLDTRHALSDVHRSDTGKVEGFQRHLCGRLTNALGTNGTHSASRVQTSSQILGIASLQKAFQLPFSNGVGGRGEWILETHLFASMQFEFQRRTKIVHKLEKLFTNAARSPFVHLRLDQLSQLFGCQ